MIIDLHEDDSKKTIEYTKSGEKRLKIIQTKK